MHIKRTTPDLLTFCWTFLLLIIVSVKVSALNVLTRRFDCTSASIDLEVTLEEGFHGVAYAFREFENPRCSVAGTGASSFRISVPLTDCGTAVVGPGRYEVNVVIQRQEKVIMDGDLSYKLICQYDLTDKTINSDINIKYGESNDPNSLLSEIPDPQTHESQGPTPSVFLRILKGAGIEGLTSTNAKVGDPMTLDLVLNDASVYTNFVVKNCYAHNREVQLELVDSVGCISQQARTVVISDAVLSQATSSSSLTPQVLHKYFAFEAFKFPDGNVVHFRCIVTLCLSNTGTCPEQCDKERRKRKTAEELGDYNYGKVKKLTRLTRNSAWRGEVEQKEQAWSKNGRWRREVEQKEQAWSKKGRWRREVEQKEQAWSKNGRWRREVEPREAEISGVIVVSAPAIDVIDPPPNLAGAGGDRLDSQADGDGSLQDRSGSGGGGRHMICVSMLELGAGLALLLGVSLLSVIITLCLCLKVGSHGKKGDGTDVQEELEDDGVQTTSASDLPKRNGGTSGVTTLRIPRPDYDHNIT